MVTKLKLPYKEILNFSFILAKNHMVTKLGISSLYCLISFILAKNHMVTKL